MSHVDFVNTGSFLSYKNEKSNFMNVLGMKYWCTLSQKTWPH